ncbi:DUF6086 family protein [Actinokineospora sp. HUAS TT18]|uniref:DUF6086 family protein n=1 Tax=Actinokineospora sp. HUAS TT18 TaxID=3447451 RepID=UPI003F520B16
MSYYFEVGGETVWNPALRIGKVYVTHAEGVAAQMGLPTGLAPADDDSCAVDVQAFPRFVDCLLEWDRTTRHPVMHALLDGLLITSLALREAIGGAVPPKSEREAALLAEATKLARSMGP